MFSLTSTFRYYLYSENTDMRKSFDGLCGIINGEIKLDPTCGFVFIFMNKRRNQVKLLHWEQGGFVLYYKRLEKGTFEKPKLHMDNNESYIEWAQLVMLIEGVSIRNYKRTKRYKLE